MTNLEWLNCFSKRMQHRLSPFITASTHRGIVLAKPLGSRGMRLDCSTSKSGIEESFQRPRKGDIKALVMRSGYD